MSDNLTLTELESYDPHAPAGHRQRRFLCPICGDEKPRDAAHRSLCLNAETGVWLCHRCGAKGLLQEFRAESGVSLRQRVKAGYWRAFGPTPCLERRRGGAEAGYDWRKVWDEGLPLTNAPAADYVARRGIPAPFAEGCGARFSSRWYGRPAVLFPIHDKTGELVAVSGRFIDGRDQPKTQTAGTKSLGVFATPGAIGSRLAAVVEGQMDALSLALCGIPSIALIGTSWAAWLPSVLAFKHVLIATDADKSGDEAAVRISEALQSLGSRILRLRPRCGKDWNDVLVGMGAEKLIFFLRGFDPQADDLARLGMAQEFWACGRAETAAFVESLIVAPEVRRTAFRSRLVGVDALQAVGGK